MSSKRLPGKPLQELGGVPMIEWVRRRLCQTTSLERVVVATEDREIVDAVQAYGGETVLTSSCSDGTTRVYEACRSLGITNSLVLNVQGDMPGICPLSVERLVQAWVASKSEFITAAVPIRDEALINSRDVVKVVMDRSGRALYFSRAPIPSRGPWFRHLGIYGFTVEALRKYTELQPGSLTQSEDLEQLRWIEAGGSIDVVLMSEALPSVDTEQQLSELRLAVSRGNLKCPEISA